MFIDLDQILLGAIGQGKTFGVQIASVHRVSQIVQGEPMLSCEEELSSRMHEDRTGSATTGNSFQSAFPEPG
jgi:hypothetical protein